MIRKLIKSHTERNPLRSPRRRLAQEKRKKKEKEKEDDEARGLKRLFSNATDDKYEGNRAPSLKRERKKERKVSLSSFFPTLEIERKGSCHETAGKKR